MIIGYARVSTADQTADLQHDALAQAGCERLYTETASGADSGRPELARMLEQLRPGDSVVVWKLDRLGRSLRHLLEIGADLSAKGVELRSLTEGIDTSTPGGKLIFSIFGALAEFERDLIRERTIAGMQAAKKRGTHVGRPLALTGSQEQTAKAALAAGQTPAEVARSLGVSRTTLYRRGLVGAA